MSNWYFNEVEMMNKHKMLKAAGSTKRFSKLAKKSGQPGLSRRGILFVGQSLVKTGKRLLDRYELAPTNDVLSQPASPDYSH